MNKSRSIVVTILMLSMSLASCNSGGVRRNPGKIYAPDMTYSQAYDAYTSNPNFADSQSSRLPVNGTIARGHQLPDHLVEGDTNAYKTYTTDLRFSADELKEGARMYNIYCGVCHGNNLDGQGPLYTSEKFLAAPANFMAANYLNMPMGTMYAAVKYGKNMMGSYASQLDVKKRWMIIAYIKQKQSENGGAPFTLGKDEPKADDAASTTAMADDHNSETH